MFRTTNKRPLAATNVPQVSCLSSSVPQVSCLSSRVHQDPLTPDVVPLPIPLHGQSLLDDVQMITSQTLKTNMGRQVSDSNNLSGVEGRSGPRVGAAEANKVKSNKWDRRRARRVQDKIAKLAEGKVVSTAILQNLNKALTSQPTERRRPSEHGIE